MLTAIFVTAFFFFQNGFCGLEEFYKTGVAFSQPIVITGGLYSDFSPKFQESSLLTTNDGTELIFIKVNYLHSLPVATFKSDSSVSYTGSRGWGGG